ncbi:MAG: hypothetical protein AAF772_07010 [Acidobacteriota bacterium]
MNLQHPPILSLALTLLLGAGLALAGETTTSTSKIAIAVADDEGPPLSFEVENLEIGEHRTIVTDDGEVVVTRTAEGLIVDRPGREPLVIDFEVHDHAQIEFDTQTSSSGAQVIDKKVIVRSLAGAGASSSAVAIAGDGTAHTSMMFIDDDGKVHRLGGKGGAYAWAGDGKAKDIVIKHLGGHAGALDALRAAGVLDDLDADMRDRIEAALAGGGDGDEQHVEVIRLKVAADDEEEDNR